MTHCLLLALVLLLPTNAWVTGLASTKRALELIERPECWVRTVVRRGEGRVRLRSTLLLVDDEDHLRQAVGSYLEDRGFAIRSSASASEALLALKRDPLGIELVVTDLTMPQVDGYQLLLQLRSYPEFAELPVVLLTARGATHDRIQGYASGCDAYLTKPFDPEELVAIVNNLLKRHRARREKDAAAASRVEALEVELAALRKWKGRSLGLSEEEAKVLKLLSQGLPKRDIATRMECPATTVGRLILDLLAKTETENKTALLRFASDHGLLADG
jgi:DNA-binding response OmpR family regulator